MLRRTQLLVIARRIAKIIIAEGRSVASDVVARVRRDPWAGRWAGAVASLVAVTVVGVITPPVLLTGPARRAATTTALDEYVPPGAIAGSTRPGRAGAEESAIQLVGRIGGVPVAATDEARAPFTNPLSPRAGVCSPLRLRVSWAPPSGQYTIGGYVSPLGPAPTAATTIVNGVVLCQGSTYAYAGFTALWTGRRWYMTPVPSASADEHQRLASDDQAATVAPAVPQASPVAAAGAAGWGPTIEPLSPYQPQTTCDPTPKPGVLGVRDLLLHSFPGSTDLGIGQSCDTPDGVSEHKEGRAFDWGVNVDDPAQRAMAEQFLAWLFAPDQYGNKYAMLRRLGIMYLIWDHHIWGSYLADQGWRPYVGVSPHTDHIHISFGWAGALGQTSFWSGHVVDVGRVQAPPGAVPMHDDPAVAAAQAAAAASSDHGAAAAAPANGAPAPAAGTAAPSGPAPAPAPGSPPAPAPAPASGTSAGSASPTDPSGGSSSPPQSTTTTTTSPPPPSPTTTTSTSTTSTTSTTQPSPFPTIPHL